MNEEQNKELDGLIKLFYTSPIKTNDDFIKEYIKNVPDRYKQEKGYRYSNLFVIRKEIRHNLLLGREFNQNREEFSEKYFTAIVLLNICLTNLIKKFYRDDFHGYLRKYAGIKNEEYRFVLRYLRNALEHNNYSLYYRIRKREIKMGDTYHKKGEKIYFRLGFFNEIISKLDNWNRPYHSSAYNINPRRLYSAFEQSLQNFEQDLLDRSNDNLREIFKRNLDIDEWILIK